ncbi:hypothetical protein [uncultured Polaribacter sp.]|uniref:hypothetical protein n=1 Tax=uncultured Polaribacter sp. TaxID=174711 RepID=UPI0030DDA08C|tara:strand:+ start:1191 stop:1502 length:312 start_codon:yes stop_codon:yes gene_type:complete
MKNFNRHYLTYFLLLFFAFSIQSCASKKSQIIVNEEVITKKYNTESSNQNILYLIDGKEVSANDIKKLEPNNIDSITVIKDQKEVAKYTAKKYEGIIIIKMKK